MQNKLQELTEKLYNEGLSKGKQEAENLIVNAKAEAEKIITQANAQAKEIVEKAQKESAEIKKKVESDINIASGQTISSIKQQIEDIIITKTIKNPVKAAASDPDFIKSVITTIAKAFDASNPNSVGLDLILPEAMKQQLQSYIESEIPTLLTSPIDVEYQKGISSGFKIGPKDGGYKISFTGNDFESIIGEYIRPATKKILFSE